MESKPTHEQAQLHLQVYDQRREARLRQARDWFGKNYIVNNIDDAMRIAPMGSETGNYVGMVISYWEQACALLNYGLLHEDLFFETSGEFFGVWERVRPIIAEGRKMFSNRVFWRTWKRLPGASSNGLKPARRARSRRCGSLWPKCSRRRGRRRASVTES